jgi:hypothetical protein
VEMSAIVSRDLRLLFFFHEMNSQFLLIYNPNRGFGGFREMFRERFGETHFSILRNMSGRFRYFVKWLLSAKLTFFSFSPKFTSY